MSKKLVYSKQMDPNDWETDARFVCSEHLTDFHPKCIVCREAEVQALIDARGQLLDELDKYQEALEDIVKMGEGYNPDSTVDCEEASFWQKALKRARLALK